MDNVLVGRLPHLGRAKRWAALCGYFDRAERDVAFRCLDHVGLLPLGWQRTDTLSGGEQQRVAIAKILAQSAARRPWRRARGEPRRRQRRHGDGNAPARRFRNRLTVIATLHHVEFACRYADRVLGLRAGRLVFDGRATDLSDAAIDGIFGKTRSGAASVDAVPHAAEPQWVAS